MPLRTVIFVDGANFRSQLRAFAFQSSPPHPSGRAFRLEEQHFNWASFFGEVIRKIIGHTGLEHRLIRVYWYYPSQISPWERWWASKLAAKVVASPRKSPTCGKTR